MSLAPATAMAKNPSQMVIKEKPIKRPRVPPKSATCRLVFAFHVADFLFLHDSPVLREDR